MVVTVMVNCSLQVYCLPVYLSPSKQVSKFTVNSFVHRNSLSALL